jgi:hypothetical protein
VNGTMLWMLPILSSSVSPGPTTPPLATSPVFEEWKWGERYQLQLGDLCMFVGMTDVYKQMHRHVVYQVVAKERADSTSLSHNRYTLRIAFDLENPSGSHTPEPTTIYGTKSLKKISLLDLATMRLHFDDFIRWWAKTQGREDTGDREDVASSG